MFAKIQQPVTAVYGRRD
jgi:hypothetical protein